jgi:hypothetical protein
MLCVKTTPQPPWPAAGSMACDEQGVQEEYHVLLSSTFAFSPAIRCLAAVIGLSGPIRESIDPCAVTCHVL